MDFSPLAPHYRWLEAALAGRMLHRMRQFGLDALAGSIRALIVGDGIGRGTEALLRAVPGAHIVVVEKSAAMLKTARERLCGRGLALDRVEFCCADIRDWDARPSVFDAIVTHFVLDCFLPRDVAEVVAHLGRMATGKALWQLADFRVPSQGWRRQRARMIHALMYGFFRRAVHLEARRLTSPDPSLQREGFVLQRRKLACAGLLHADVWVRG